MRILLTNDDGIFATGLIALSRQVAGLGEVQIVAPERSRSAIGHAITLHKPLRMDLHYHSEYSVPAYATNGTPADCVMLGYYELFEKQIDLVISGINSGPNLGDDVTYSGTVSAAMEAAVIGVPSIAVSMGDFNSKHYDDAATFIAQLAKLMVEMKAHNKTLLNVNYPNLPMSDVKGLRLTRLGHRWYTDVVTSRLDPRGTPYFWICGEKQYSDNPKGTDCKAIEDGEISITPLTMDLTCYKDIDDFSKLTDTLVKKLKLGG